VGRFREYLEVVDRLLREEVTSYEGRYYRVKGAVMNPRPVQKPRPPLTIAALGPAMLRMTARYADRWNTYGGPRVTAGEAVGVVGEQVRMLYEFCGEIGREPGEIRRSMTLYGGVAGMNPFASVEAFRDCVEAYREVGMNEFLVYYPPQEFYSPSRAEQERVFERVAVEVLPGLRGEGGEKGLG
jgi:alkanesulfonate monooxygenase SsuD/methylene tetrahydromethanopterin reductase-like flavin-dependent oxidoreductase (luciferase family)